MERDAETILKALKKYQPYKGEKESTIAKQLGYDVHRFENELNRLEQDVQALTMALHDYDTYKDVNQTDVMNNLPFYRQQLKQLKQLRQLKLEPEDVKALTKSLQDYKMYRHLKQEDVIKKPAYYQQQLSRLQQHFDYFEQLPDDLQGKILSERSHTLRKSPKISQRIRNSPSVNHAYYKQYCHLPISNQELTKYLSTTLTDYAKIEYDDETENNDEI